MAAVDAGRMYQQGWVVQRPTSGLAVGALVAGLFGVLGGWCLCGLPCIAAVVLGHMATRETRTGARGGHGMAVAGLILGYVFVVPAIVLTFWVVLGGALQGASA
jgi:hypothetical protein